jgi:hypothetical protein
LKKGGRGDFYSLWSTDIGHDRLSRFIHELFEK